MISDALYKCTSRSHTKGSGMDYFQFNPDLENHIVAQLSQTYIGFDKYNRNTHVFDFSNKHDKAKYLATRHRLASIFNINALFDMQGKKNPRRQPARKFYPERNTCMVRKNILYK